jgi:hypothetical protein
MFGVDCCKACSTHMSGEEIALEPLTWMGTVEIYRIRASKNKVEHT